MTRDRVITSVPRQNRRLNQVSSTWSENKYLPDIPWIIGIMPGKATYTTIMSKDIQGYSAERNNYTVKCHQTHKMKASPPITPAVKAERLIWWWKKTENTLTSPCLPLSFHWAWNLYQGGRVWYSWGSTQSSMLDAYVPVCSHSSVLWQAIVSS